MPIRFSISEPANLGLLERHLEELSYRAFDLKPMADRAAVIMERQNADGAAMGIDKDGNSYKELAPATWKRRSGGGPPLAPRVMSSPVVADFDVKVEAGGFDEMIVRGRWPNSPWMKYHVTGAPRNGNMPIRNPVGIRPHGWLQLNVEFHNWIQEVLTGKKGGGPSAPPTGGGGGGGSRGEGGGGGPSAAPTPSSSPARPPGTPSAARSVTPPIPSREVPKPASSYPAADDDDDIMIDIAHLRAKPVEARSPGSPVAISYGHPSEYRARELPGRVARVKRLTRDILGREGTPEEVARLAGIPDDATEVTIRPADFGIGGLEIDIRTPTVKSMKRTIMRPFNVGDPGARSTKISNQEFKVEKGSQGKGIGATVFARQVEAAAKAGFTRIETYAARDDGPDPMNGYLTWPKLGYDGAIPYRVAEDLPRELSGAKTISDLMKTPEGWKFWEAHGMSADLSFDLTPGSRSRKVLDAYLKRKGLQP